MKTFFTSESVTEGHPDKICDKISDKILDEALKQDKDSKMAVETTIKDNFVLIYGEANTKANLDYENIAKWVLKDIGYDDDFEVLLKVGKQSSEINAAVVKEEICAGDQGIMFGYATLETEELMPLPIMLANKLAHQLTLVRKEGNLFLRPDGKTQVTVEYENGVPKRVDTVIIASQHVESILQDELKKIIEEEVVKKVIPSNLMDDDTKILVNTSGSFILGGPFGDSGTTGRKIICDTYGGMGRIGGGCFSSKDPSKVDRSAAYYARYVAKNIVAHDLAQKCEIQLSYTIGKSNPISLFIDTFNTEKVDIDKIYKYVYDNFDFSVSNIIKELDLLKPIYYDLASYGHFGRETTWEKIKS
ncbi:MAG: methionine adenosyltransferase [Bacilli bacterium]|nr:methionine adenosyltransferase [Bacilli bacterium]MDD4733333.1 methionine adenosyltransferase [Bacilli bacterium]